jgi:hypothetical protein
MTTEEILDELTEAVGRMGLTVRTEKGNFDGGRCRMGGEEVVMLNERDLPERRLAVLARTLPPEEMETVYLPPAVRKRLHEIWDDPDGDDPDGSDPGRGDAEAQPDRSPDQQQEKEEDRPEQPPAYAD